MDGNKCEIAGCNSIMFQRLNGVRLCAKHHSQMKLHGKILDRTIFDKNEIIVDGQYAYIVLYDKCCNEIERTKIDKCNVNLIKDYKWYLRKDGYVATTNYNGKYTYLHKLICNSNSKKYVDHIDRNKLNNTMMNLRTADGSENQMNKGIRSNNTSGKVGVHWNKDNSKWCAMICVRKKHINLGYFEKFEDAVNARVNAEKKYFKEYRASNELEVNNI